MYGDSAYEDSMYLRRFCLRRILIEYIRVFMHTNFQQKKIWSFYVYEDPALGDSALGNDSRQSIIILGEEYS